MPISLPRSSRLALALLPLAAALTSACGTSEAQSASNAEDDQFAKVEIKTETLAPGIAVLFGAGGNIGLSYGDDGTTIIDDQFAPLTPKILSAAKELGAAPPKYLINTHWHYDHTGGNANLGGQGVLILAQDNVRTRLAGEQSEGKGNDPASPAEALPVITYGDSITMHLNGDTVKIMHMPHGHTDGDSVVYWSKANVLHMGDLFFNKVTLPFIDLDSGGNAEGMLAGVEKALTIVNADTKIIPGHGPMASKADLEAYRDMLRSVIDAVRSARQAGKTLEQIQAMKPAAKWDTNPDAFIKGDAFVKAVYNSLG